jgi:hypothetical protein
MLPRCLPEGIMQRRLRVRIAQLALGACGGDAVKGTANGTGTIIVVKGALNGVVDAGDGAERTDATEPTVTVAIDDVPFDVVMFALRAGTPIWCTRHVTHEYRLAQPA